MVGSQCQPPPDIKRVISIIHALLQQANIPKASDVQYIL